MTDTSTHATRTVEGIEIPEPGTFDLDVAHSAVGFTVRHLMVSKTRGSFGTFSGTVVIGEDPYQSSVEVTIDPTSISTGDAKRDEHLRSADFFDTDQFGEITFRSTEVRDHKGDRFVLEGDLTVHGVTRPVVLDAVFEGIATSPWGTQAVGFSATTELDREAFGLTWNQTLETGGVLVGKTVKVEIEAEINRRQAS
ncbi:MAG: polyisoprenoid-binding protein [Acidimicrobiia bacterium]|nr:polyisoprenoid-binding protein [Acidimicrobiia bacterium]